MNKPSRLSDQTVMFVTDGNFAIRVTDLGKAEDFYGNVLGFKLSKRTDERLVCWMRKAEISGVKPSTIDIAWLDLAESAMLLLPLVIDFSYGKTIVSWLD